MVADFAALPGEGGGGGRALLWAAAAAAAVGSHAAVVAWALQRPEAMAFEAASPAAVMIELAPAPVAPAPAEATEVAPDLHDAPDIASEPVEDSLMPPPT